MFFFRQHIRRHAEGGLEPIRLHPARAEGILPHPNLPGCGVDGGDDAGGLRQLIDSETVAEVLHRAADIPRGAAKIHYREVVLKLYIINEKNI